LQNAEIIVTARSAIASPRKLEHERPARQEGEKGLLASGTANLPSISLRRIGAEVQKCLKTMLLMDLCNIIRAPTR
jgi:hypothetical protein